MMMFKNIILFISFAFCYGCIDQKKEKEATEIIVAIDHSMQVSVFNLVDSVTIVPLETSDSCLISTISRIVKHGNQLYVLDRKINTFFCFDLNGKLQFKINRTGNGPGEYQYIETFAVNPQGEILLLEPWGNLYCFDSTG